MNLFAGGSGVTRVVAPPCASFAILRKLAQVLGQPVGVTFSMQCFSDPSARMHTACAACSASSAASAAASSTSAAIHAAPAAWYAACSASSFAAFS